MGRQACLQRQAQGPTATLPSLALPVLGSLQVVVVEQLLDEVHVRQQHSPAAVARELQGVEGVAAEQGGRRARKGAGGRGWEGPGAFGGGGFWRGVAHRRQSVSPWRLRAWQLPDRQDRLRWAVVFSPLRVVGL